MSKKNDIQALAEHSRSICEQYLDGQPYDRLRLVNEARFCLAQSAEAMLEAGKRLLVIKESEPHGDFTRIVEHELGLEHETARRMINAAVKFLSPKLQGKSSQFALLGKSKLYELMLEDDDELAALADGGTVAGLELDDVERMSCRELKKALRSAREDNAAKDEVLADKAAKIAKLETAKKKLKALPPDEEGEAIRKEAAGACFEVECALRDTLFTAIQTVQQHAADHQLESPKKWVEGQILHLDEIFLMVASELGVGIQRTGTAPEWESAQ